MKWVHPIDRAVDGFAAGRKAIVQRLMSDGVFCAIDQEVLTAYDDNCDELGAYRRRAYAADAYVRNDVTRHVKAAFKDAGAAIVDLDAERKARAKIVTFPRRDTTPG